MKHNCSETEVDISSSYDEVETAFDEMKDTYEAVEDDMYPNGRDYDAENFDE